MRISRRHLLRRLAAGAVVTTAMPFIDEASCAAAPRSSSAHRHGGPIRLNLNENAYGPSERAVATLRDSLGLVHRYPDSADALVGEIAALHGVTRERVVLGCGSTEILRMAAATFLGPRKKVVLASPTFDLIAEYARSEGAEVATVPLDKRYAHDLDAMLAQADAPGSLVYICNPNNPTGGLTRRQDLEAFFHNLPATTCVLIDEAYHHYVGISSDYASFIDRPVDDHRVIVVRSFSKIHGSAARPLSAAGVVRMVECTRQKL